MSHLSIQDRIFIIKEYFSNNESVHLVQVAWRREKKTKVNLKHDTIKRTVDRFLETGSVHDRTCPPKPTPKRTPDKIEEVRQLIRKNPKVSTRKGCQMVGMTHTSYYLTLVKDLNLFPYKISVVQQLNSESIEQRLHFSNQLLEKIDEGEINPHQIWFTDEAHFYLNGYVNSQNYRIWGTENPHAIREKPLHSARLSVWCAIDGLRVIGPFFFTNTMNWEVYRDILQKQFIRETPVQESLTTHFFMQDGAPPHRKGEVVDWLADQFDGRLIAKKANREWLQWAPYSPDLNPCDFFLWGTIKDKVYKDNPLTLNELKLKITEEIGKITLETCSKVMDNFVLRLKKVQEQHGSHFEILL